MLIIIDHLVIKVRVKLLKLTFKIPDRTVISQYVTRAVEVIIRIEHELSTPL